MESAILKDGVILDEELNRYVEKHKRNGTFYDVTKIDDFIADYYQFEHQKPSIEMLESTFGNLKEVNYVGKKQEN